MAGTLQLQKALKREGFDPGPLDGMPGPKTEAAELAYKTWYSTLPDIIDVSAAQGPNINWTQVKAAGIAGVYLKATEGVSYVDPMFAHNLSGARAAGLLVGCYMVTHPRNSEVQEVKFFTQKVKEVNGSLKDLLPPMDDIEVDDENMAEDASQVRTSLQSMQQEWGRPCLAYSYGPFVFGHKLDFAALPWVYYWHAEYCGDTPPTHIYPGMPPWRMHQFLGNNGRCPGVPVACDRDKFRGTVEELRAL